MMKKSLKFLINLHINCVIKSVTIRKNYLNLMTYSAKFSIYKIIKNIPEYVMSFKYICCLLRHKRPNLRHEKLMKKN